MPTRIFLIRHGQTDFSKNKLYCGRKDIALNQTGKKQAECLRMAFAKIPLSAVYASDLGRAFQTAAVAFNKKRSEIIPDRRLREIDFGLWEGLSSPQIGELYPALYAKWLKFPQRACIPQGERLVDFKKRITSFLDEVLAKHKDEDIALVSHGGTIKIVLFEVLGLGLKSFWIMNQDNAGISLVEFCNGWRALRYFNNTSHLEALNEKK